MVDELTIPSSLETERSILGHIFNRPEQFYDCHRITDQAFTVDAHQRIYRARASMAEAGMHIDFITVTHELQRRRELETIGGASYLSAFVSHQRLKRGRARPSHYSFAILRSCFKDRKPITDYQDNPQANRNSEQS